MATATQISDDQAAERMRALPTVDWDDLEAAAENTQLIAETIGNDKALLRALVDRTACTPALREKCECHALDDKIVLWHEPERGLKIRLRLANEQQYERVHNHRYAFTAYVLTGVYYQTLYATDQPLDETADVAGFWPCVVREEKPGDFITLHHLQLHTTLTTPDTISLMIQSDARQERGFMIRRSDGEVWYKRGAAEEDDKRREEVAMSDERFAYWRKRLAGLDVI
jgi:hypothetical protein